MTFRQGATRNVLLTEENSMLNDSSQSDIVRSTFGRCPACTAIVTMRQWHNKHGWIECPTPLSPLLGLPHQCVKVTGEEHNP